MTVLLATPTILKSLASERNAGMCAVAAQLLSGLKPMNPALMGSAMDRSDGFEIRSPEGTLGQAGNRDVVA